MLKISCMRSAISILALVSVMPLTAHAVTLTPTVTDLSSPIGIAHYQPTNNLIVSVNNGNGKPYNFEKIASVGSHSKFSDVSGLTEEIRVDVVRDTLGGFTVGELFSATGAVGVIARISADGATIQNPWVTLPGEKGHVRGLHFDRTGVFGGDLIVATDKGKAWRVNSAGIPTLVAKVGSNPKPTNPLLEGLTTVPNNPEKYGPWAGKTVAAGESVNKIYAIGTDGNFTSYDLGIEEPEDVVVIPANENFFGIDMTGRSLYGAPSSEFVGMVGDILISQEEKPGNLFSVHWDGTNFQVTKVAEVIKWEQMTFSTAGVMTIPEIIISGCINLNGLPVKGRNVVLKEKGETSKTTKSDINGNYLFDKNSVVFGKSFQIIINGPKVKKVDDEISGCINLKGTPVVGRKVTFKQKGELIKVTFTDSAGKYQFSGAVPGKTFQLRIYGPKIK